MSAEGSRTYSGNVLGLLGGKGRRGQRYEGVSRAGTCGIFGECTVVKMETMDMNNNNV